MNLTQQIEQLIRERPHNAGEIKDVVKVSYPEIFATLRDLCEEGKAIYYFTDTNVLTYRAKNFWEK
jgi:hypothetical protein